MNAVTYFHALDAIGPWLAPAIALACALCPWPRRLWRRCLPAVFVGWAAFAAFTILLYNPAGIAAGQALGEHFPAARYDNNTVGVALFFGWLVPAAVVGLYALAHQGWLRVQRRGA